jgi:hypothetical protein
LSGTLDVINNLKRTYNGEYNMVVDEIKETSSLFDAKTGSR